MGITYNDFIRTTEPRHQAGAQKLFTELYNRGHIYLSTYTGAYCVSDEAFVDLPVGTPCPDCGRILEEVTEENFFFRLSAFQQPLIDLIESSTLAIQPDVRRNEVLSFVKGGLKDLSISRSSFKWGIPVPAEVQQKAGATQPHIIYVWLDALTNYMTAIGYGSDDPADQAKFKKYWPADLHLVGKEIIRFHCVYWPAFLMAAGLQLPKAITAHGWLLFEESKMSKSRGNIVRTETILDTFGTLLPEAAKHEQDLFASDVLRYFLLREIPFGQDGSFSFDALYDRYNADLTNGYGNLTSRVLALIQQNFEGHVPIGEIVKADPTLGFTTELANLTNALTKEFDVANGAIFLYFNDAWDRFDFHEALGTTGIAIKRIDEFLTWTTPWKLAKIGTAEAKTLLSTILYNAAESIRIITALLYPILPYATSKVWSQLGLGSIEQAAKNGELKNLQWGGLKPGTKLGPLSPIFPRAPKELIQLMTDMENPTTPKPEAPAPPTPEAAPTTIPPAETAVESSPTITIDDFAKIDLRVARILVAERIPKADKLLRLQVDLGYETRQILSGIAEWYTPEELIGRKIVIIANLAPRKMRGLESHGMLLAASHGEGGKPILATFTEDIELGSRLK